MTSHVLQVDLTVACFRPDWTVGMVVSAVTYGEHVIVPVRNKQPLWRLITKLIVTRKI